MRSAQSAVVLLALAVAALLSSRQFVAPGQPAGIDVWPHLVRARIVYEAARAGFSPFYSFLFYSGYPHLRFYGPLFFGLAGLTALLFRGDVVASSRGVLLLLHLGSVALMYWCLRRRWSIPAAALGAMVYALMPWRVRHVSLLGTYPQALFYVLLPLCCRLVERLARQPSVRLGLALGAAGAAALLAHPVYVPALAVFLLPFLLANLDRQRPGAVLLCLGLGLATALAVSGFSSIPFLVEFRSHAFPRLATATFVPDVLALLGLRSRTGSAIGAYLGLSTVGLVLVGCVGLLVRRARARVVPFVVVAGLSLALALSGPVLGRGVLADLGLMPERFLLFFVFAAAGLAAAAFDFVCRAPGLRRWPLVAFLVLTAVVTADMLPEHLRLRFAGIRRMLSDRAEMCRAIGPPARTRVLDLAEPKDRLDELARTDFYPAINFLCGGLATPLGPPFRQFAPRSMAYVYPWVNRVAQDFADTTSASLSPATTTALRLLGVSHVLAQPTEVSVGPGGAEPPGFRLRSSVDWEVPTVGRESRAVAAIAGTGAGLALASARTRPFPVESLVADRSLFVAGDWQMLLESLAVDTAANRLRFIPVRGDVKWPDLPDTWPVVRVTRTEMAHNRVVLDLTASADCYLRLALSYYPWLRVTLNGQTRRFFETKEHFVFLPCPAGAHRIEVTAPLTPLRKLLIPVSVAAALASLAAAILYGRAATPATSRP